MAEALTLEILTPAGAVEKVAGVSVPGVEVPGTLGDLGILPDHIPLISGVLPGVVRAKIGGEPVRYAVGTGFVEVDGAGAVSILVDRCAGADDVDRAEVQEAAKRVRVDLEREGKVSAETENYRRLERELRWLEAQLQVAAH